MTTPSGLQWVPAKLRDFIIMNSRSGASDLFWINEYQVKRRVSVPELTKKAGEISGFLVKSTLVPFIVIVIVIAWSIAVSFVLCAIPPSYVRQPAHPW